MGTLLFFYVHWTRTASKKENSIFLIVLKVFQNSQFLICLIATPKKANGLIELWQKLLNNCNNSSIAKNCQIESNLLRVLLSRV